MVPHRPARCRGLTLIELVIVLGIAAILVAAGLPSYADMTSRHRLAMAAQQLAMELQQARYEAVQLNRPVYVGFRAGPQWCFAVSQEPACDCAGTLPAACAQRRGDAQSYGGVAMEQAQSVVFDPRLGQAGVPLAATLRLGERIAEVQLAGSGRARACARQGDLPGLPRCG